jgi:hypothetical protein
MKINNNISGIYRITNKETGKHYIGSAVNMRKRWKQHRNKLRKGTHDSKYLQSSFYKWGMGVFEFLPIEEIENLDELLTHEQKWMDYYKSYDRDFGYNVLRVAGSNWKKKVSDESRKKMSDSHLGKRRSVPAMDKILKSMYKKVYQIDKKTLKVLNEFDSIKQASEATNIPTQLISNTCRRRGKSTHGYYWSFDIENFTPLEKCHNTPLEIRYIFCPKTNKRWKTIKNAGDELGLTKNQIYSKIKWKELEYVYEKRI